MFVTYPDVRYLSGCVLEAVGGGALPSRLDSFMYEAVAGVRSSGTLRGDAEKPDLPRPRRYEATEDGDSP